MSTPAGTHPPAGSDTALGLVVLAILVVVVAAAALVLGLPALLGFTWSDTAVGATQAWCRLTS